MTDRHPLFYRYPADNLLRTPLLAGQHIDKLPDLTVDTRLCLVVTPRQRQIMGMLGSVAIETSIPAKLPADRSSWVSCV